MLHPDGLEVVVKSVTTGNQYHEYERAGDTDADNEKMVRYIEAVSDERFMIEVRIKPTFLYYSAEGISISTRIDGGVVRRKNFMYKRCRDMKEIQQVFEKNHTSAKVGGQWAKIGFAFGELQFGTYTCLHAIVFKGWLTLLADDDLTADTTLLKRQGSRLGNIQITVQRGYYKRRTTPKKLSSECAATEAASPRLLKDSKISHATK